MNRLPGHFVPGRLRLRGIDYERDLWSSFPGNLSGTSILHYKDRKKYKKNPVNGAQYINGGRGISTCQQYHGYFTESDGMPDCIQRLFCQYWLASLLRIEICKRIYGNPQSLENDTDDFMWSAHHRQHIAAS